MTQIKVGDFGLACVFQHSSQEVTMMAQPSHHFEHKGGQLGTKLYAALEQLQGSCNPKVSVFVGKMTIKVIHKLIMFLNNFTE